MSQWLGVAQWVLSAAVGVLMFVVLRGFQSGKWVQERDDKIADLQRSIGVLTTRMDKAGAETSKLATDVQGIPERLRAIFVPRELYGATESINVDEHRRMRDDIERLWQQVRSTRNAR